MTNTSRRQEAVYDRRLASIWGREDQPRKRRPYSKPTVTRRDFEHLIDLECRANPAM
jgi:hypothetical protein